MRAGRSNRTGLRSTGDLWHPSPVTASLDYAFVQPVRLVELCIERIERPQDCRVVFQHPADLALAAAYLQAMLQRVREQMIDVGVTAIQMTSTGIAIDTNANFSIELVWYTQPQQKTPQK